MLKRAEAVFISRLNYYTCWDRKDRDNYLVYDSIITERMCVLLYVKYCYTIIFFVHVGKIYKL